MGLEKLTWLICGPNDKAGWHSKKVVWNSRYSKRRNEGLGRKSM